MIELISDFSPDADGEFAMMRRLVERSGRPLSLSLAQSHRRPDAWRDLLGADRGGRRRGAAHPGPGGAAAGRRAARAAGLVQPVLRPPRLRARSPGARWPSRSARCATPPFRARLLPRRDATTGGARAAAAGRPLAHVPARRRPRLRAAAGDAASQRLAEARGVDPAEVGASTSWRRTTGATSSTSPFLNYADGNLDACGEMLAHPDTVFGLGDGGAHVGIISDASFPTYVPLALGARPLATAACRWAGSSSS